jgi:histone-lysine N-methyltransferase SETD1
MNHIQAIGVRMFCELILTKFSGVGGWPLALCATMALSLVQCPDFSPFALHENSQSDLSCRPAFLDATLFTALATPTRRLSAPVQNPNHHHVLLSSDRYLDESAINDALSKSRATAAFQRLSYASGFVEFTTATMAEHAAARLHRQFPNLELSFRSPISMDSLLADRLRQKSAIHSPPKCLALHGVDPGVDLGSLFAPLDLVSFELSGQTIRTFHRDAASVCDFMSAFRDGFAGIAGLSVSEVHPVRDRAVEILIERLIDAATTDCALWLTKEIAGGVLPARKRAPRRERAKSPGRADPDLGVDVDFDSIRQPDVDRGSSRLTPFRRLREWHKRMYLRPCALARRSPYVAARKGNSRLLESQVVRDPRSGPRTYWEKSPIHGFGLFALEPIYPGELICNYTGQLIRMRVADLRDERAQSRGIGHTFMFRIGDNVIDATHAGCNARFLNCSCQPNCRAETVQVAGADRVSFFATRAIRPHDEITFDFKMQLEKDPSKWEFCYCCAPTCNGYLNYSVYRDELARRKREENLMQSDSDTELP